MKVPVDLDETKDSRVISLTTIDEKIGSYLSHQATVFANIFEKRGMEFTEEEKKALFASCYVDQLSNENSDEDDDNESDNKDSDEDDNDDESNEDSDENEDDSSE